MMRNKNDSTLASTFIFIIAAITFITGFIVLAIKKGRTKELLISTPILIGVYWILVGLSSPTLPFADTIRAMSFPSVALTFVTPLIIYSLYWVWLLSNEKITSVKANSNWSNKEWWWTLDGWEFEEEVAKIFRLNGYKAKVTKKTGDGGIDIILYKNDLKYVVQCKHYRNPVGPEPVRALWGVKDDFGADKVIMVASSGLTDSAYSFIEHKRDFELYNLEDIISMGLRPHEEKDYIDAEVIVENKANEIEPYFPW